MVDNSGSMREKAGGRHAAEVPGRARGARGNARVDRFVRGEAAGLSDQGRTLLLLVAASTRWCRCSRTIAAALRAALESMPTPNGGTAIGEAMDVARDDLYRVGHHSEVHPRRHRRREHRRPSAARGRAGDRRAQRRCGSHVLRRVRRRRRRNSRSFATCTARCSAPAMALALRASLDTIYRGKILAEAVDAGETHFRPTRPRILHLPRPRNHDHGKILPRHSRTAEQDRQHLLRG